MSPKHKARIRLGRPGPKTILVLLLLACGLIGWGVGELNSPAPQSLVVTTPSSAPRIIPQHTLPVRKAAHKAPAVVAQMRYTVRADDTLWTISAARCHAGTDWLKLYHGNIKTIGPDPNRIFTGQVLILTC